MFKRKVALGPTRPLARALVSKRRMALGPTQLPTTGAPSEPPARRTQVWDWRGLCRPGKNGTSPVPAPPHSPSAGAVRRWPKGAWTWPPLLVAALWWKTASASAAPGATEQPQGLPQSPQERAWEASASEVYAPTEQHAQTNETAVGPIQNIGFGAYGGQKRRQRYARMYAAWVSRRWHPYGPALAPAPPHAGERRARPESCLMWRPLGARSQHGPWHG